MNGSRAGLRASLPRVRRAQGRRLATGLVLALGGACACLAGVLRRDAPPVRPLLSCCVVATLAACVVAGRERQRSRSAAWLVSSARAARTPLRHGTVGWGVLAWVALVLTAVASDLVFVLVVKSPDAPTLSRLIGAVTARPAGRALLFAAWLGAGSWIALGWRRSPP